MKLLRTIRFDASDGHVFEHAAAPDEWAVSGAFAFAEADEAALAGKFRQAFANGFLGLASFGRATFVSVAEAKPADYDAALEALARHLVEAWNAPDMNIARAAAREELAFAADLAEGAAVNTLIAVRRSFDEAGQIREEFRTVVRSAETPHARIWDVIENG